MAWNYPQRPEGELRSDFPVLRSYIRNQVSRSGARLCLQLQVKLPFEITMRAEGEFLQGGLEVSDKEFEQKVDAILERGGRSLFESMSSLGYAVPVQPPMMDTLFKASRNGGLASLESIVIETTPKQRFFFQRISTAGKNTEFLGERLKDKEVVQLIATKIEQNKFEFVVAAKFYFQIPENSSVALRNYFHKGLELLIDRPLVSPLESILRQQNPRFEKLRTFFVNPDAPGQKRQYKKLVRAIDAGEARNLPIEFLND